MMRTILWTIWGLVPVAVLAFHFGPGQHLAARDLAARLQVDAIEAERAAMTAQDDAYAAHLATNELRRQAFLGSDAALGARLEAAIATEERLYAVAAAAWEEAADAYEHVESALTDRPGPERDRVRLARARALVRSGDIWGGADELEVLLMELDDADQGSSELARATREELAGAH
ncbi:MAG: hypothetical protein KDA25_02340, partial [Phycisphaerales bacterium]|nr:hypothetical protein [Phycisphaerales bacterium]